MENINNYIGGETVVEKFPELLKIVIDFVATEYNDKVEDFGYSPEIPENGVDILIVKLIQMMVIGLYWQPLMTISNSLDGMERAAEIAENLPKFMDKVEEFNIKFSAVMTGLWKNIDNKGCTCPMCELMRKCNNTIEVKKIQKFFMERYERRRNL